MAGMKLTEKSVEQAVCPPGKKDMLVFDAELRGFGLRVTSAGNKTFLAQYTAGGEKRRKALGIFGVLTVKEARAAAKAVLGDAARGGDPVAEAKATRAAAAKVAAEVAFTVRKLVESWAEARAVDRRDNYIRIARAHLLRNLADVLDRPASSLTTGEVVRLLDKAKKEIGTVTANRTLAYARAAYGWAVKRQTVDANPFRGVERPGRETPRERVLTGPELAAIWKAADGLGLVLGSAVRLMILTLQRGQEVAGMRWDELDDAKAPKLWTIPMQRAKNGRSHVVHLSEPARAVLRGMPRIVGNPYVFAGQGKRSKDGVLEREPQPTRSLNYAKTEIDATLARAEAARAASEGGEPRALVPWVFHDFRRSGVTALADMGFSPHVCDRLLNHVGGSIHGVALVYQKAEFMPERRAALDAWGAFVASGGETTADNVLPLVRAG